MKIIIVHGDDQQKIDQRIKLFLNKAKKDLYNICYLNQDQSIISTIRSNDLFQSKSMVIVDNYQNINKTNIEWINKNYNLIDSILIIYNYKKINTKFINSIKVKTINEEYNLPKIIWQFLESIYPNNLQKSQNLFHQTLKSNPIELVFYLICKQFIDMYLVLIGNNSLPSWRLKKLKNQADKYGKNKLIESIQNLSLIDIKSKTGMGDLKDLLDFFMITNVK